ncbi:hypothetical protein NPIL_294781, partial [Nephila pilipes]
VIVGSFMKTIEFVVLWLSGAEDNLILVVKSLSIFPTVSFAYGIFNLFGLAFYNAFCESLPPEDLEFNCNSPTMNEYKPLFKCCKS